MFAERRIQRKYVDEYKSLKNAIYEKLRHRPDFQHGIDTALIDLAARLYADWLYIEELLASEEGKRVVWRYTCALANVHVMLIATLEQLKVTPKMREKITQEIVQDDQVTTKLKKLMGAQ
jgi:hypothetical protein